LENYEFEKATLLSTESAARRQTEELSDKYEDLMLCI